jgi:hypothetical protein
VVPRVAILAAAVNALPEIERDGQVLRSGGTSLRSAIPATRGCTLTEN